MSIITTFQAFSPELPLVTEAATASNTLITLGNILSADPDQPVFIVAVRSKNTERFERALKESEEIGTTSPLNPIDDRSRYRIRMTVPMPSIHFSFSGGSSPLTVGHNALIRTNGYSQRWMAETSYSTVKRSFGSAVRARFWYREFRKIVLMFAISNIEHLCEPL